MMPADISPLCHDHLLEMRLWTEEYLNDSLDFIECGLAKCALGCNWLSYYGVLTVDLVEAKLLGAFYDGK